MRTSRSCLLAVAALFVVLGRPTRAEEPVAGAQPTRLPLTVADLPADRSTWFGVYLGKTKSGWVEESLRREGDAIVYRQTLHVEAKAMGQTVRVDVAERWEYDAAPPFAARSASRKMDQNGVVQTVAIRKTERGFLATVEGGGSSRELPAPVGDLTLADALTPERWFRGAPAKGASVTVRTFDLDELREDRVTYTVTAAEPVVVQGVPSTVYSATASSQVHGALGDWRFGDDGLLVSMKVGGLFEARRESEETAKKIEAGGDLFIQGLLPVEGRIAAGFEEVGKVTELVLEARGEGAEWLRTGPRQQVSKDEAAGVTVVSLGAAHGTPDEASAEEVARALEETPGYPTKDPRVVALAKTAIGDATEPRQKVERLVAFVSEFLKDELCTHAVPVVSLLESKEGDCSEHAALFATLARAVGVPAREVSGVMYMGDQIAEAIGGGFGGHAWNEVALDGTWVPVDATHDQVELDATHIALGREGRQGDFTMISGRLSFKVRSVVPPPGPPKPKLESSEVPENPTAPVPAPR